MRNHRLLIWALAAFFVFGGLGNLWASPAILEDYARWGFPAGFNLVTGTLELATAGLLVRVPRAGLALGACIMVGAVATVTWHGEFAHALPGLVVLALIALAGVKAPPSGGAG